MRKIAVTAALLSAAVGVTAGTANGAPNAPSHLARDVAYHADRVGDAAVITIDTGSMIVENNIFEIKATDGTVLAGTPLAFRLDQFQFPIDAKIDSHKATLTPRLTVADAVYKPVALPFEESAPWKTPYDREVAAFTRLKDTVSTGAAIGAAAGLIGGGIIGCGAGALVGTAVTGVLLALFGAGPIAGCLAGAAIGAPLGGIVGALLITAPVAIAAIIQYAVTTNQPFVPGRQPK